MFRLRRSAVPAVLLVSVIGGRLHFDGSRRAVRADGSQTASGGGP